MFDTKACNTHETRVPLKKRVPAFSSNSQASWRYGRTYPESRPARSQSSATGSRLHIRTLSWPISGGNASSLPVRAQHHVLVDRAVERGEVSADTDPDVVLDLLFGAAYHRLLQSHLPLSDRFAKAVVDAVVAGVRPNPAGADSYSEASRG